MKTCTVCKKEKDLTDFYNYAASKDGKMYRCKVCDGKARAKWTENNPERHRESQRDRNIKLKYGISTEEYNALLEKQGGCCAVCDTYENHGKSFSVDHCHETNEIRGLLCNQCNRGIGMLGDNLEGVQKALRYLERFKVLRRV